MPSADPIASMVVAAPLPNAGHVSSETIGLHNDVAQQANERVIALAPARTSSADESSLKAFLSATPATASPPLVETSGHGSNAPTAPQAGRGSGSGSGAMTTAYEVDHTSAPSAPLSPNTSHPQVQSSNMAMAQTGTGTGFGSGSGSSSSSGSSPGSGSGGTGTGTGGTGTGTGGTGTGSGGTGTGTGGTGTGSGGTGTGGTGTGSGGIGSGSGGTGSGSGGSGSGSGGTGSGSGSGGTGTGSGGTGTGSGGTGTGSGGTGTGSGGTGTGSGGTGTGSGGTGTGSGGTGSGSGGTGTGSGGTGTGSGGTGTGSGGTGTGSGGTGTGSGGTGTGSGGTGTGSGGTGTGSGGTGTGSGGTGTGSGGTGTGSGGTGTGSGGTGTGSGGTGTGSGGGSSSTAIVSGEVWFDKDADGILDNEETGLYNVAVTLETSTGTVVQTTTTDADGNYSFDVDLSSGSGSGEYQVQVSIPNGDVATQEDVSSPEIVSNINSSGSSDFFTLAAGGTQTVNAGMAVPNVTGKVWGDDNANGVLDGAESGLAGITVNLVTSSGFQVASATTDANGNYSFLAAPSPGSQYQIQVVIPAGDTSTIEAVNPSEIDSDIDANGYSNVFTVAPGGAETINAGLVLPKVSGEVWMDTNDDGILNDGETGLAGITVNLDDPTGTVLMTTTTDANGNYSFIVAPSQGTQFQIQVVIPNGDVSTQEDVSSPGTVSDIDANGYSNVFALAPGGVETINAGMAVPNVSGMVWFDNDGDGILDNGETGLPGITVNLDDPSGTVLMTTTTDANGNYSFIVAPSQGTQFQIQVVIPNGDSATFFFATSTGIFSSINTFGYSNSFSLSGGGTVTNIDAGIVIGDTGEVSGDAVEPTDPVSSNTPAVFNLTRQGDTSQALNVYYTLDGSATYGVDYTGAIPVSGSGSGVYQATIPAGATSTQVTFTPLNTAFNAQGESILMSIVGASPSVLGVGKFSILQTGAIQITQQDGTVTQVPSSSAALTTALQDAVKSGNLITSLRITGHADTYFIQLNNDDDKPDLLVMSSDGTKLTPSVDGIAGNDLVPLLKQALTADASVRLQGCHTAYGNNSMAQNLSNDLPGRTVRGGARYLLRVGTNSAFGKMRPFLNGEAQ